MPKLKLTSKPPLGVLLVGHGSRDDSGTAQFMETAARVAERLPQMSVEPCFLELARPTIDEGFARLVLRNIDQILVMPLLLFAAGHAKRDIPAVVSRAAAAHPQVSIAQTPHLGCHDAIVELSAVRFEEALVGRPEIPPEDTLLLMVGRGSQDAEATREMHAFAKLRHARIPVGRFEVSFLAMAEPSLQSALEAVAGLAYRRIVVQPHLLFEGLLVTDLCRQVAAAADRQTENEWLVAEPLGPAELLAGAAVERIVATAQKVAGRPNHVLPA